MNDMRDWPPDLPVFGTDLDAERARPRPDVDAAEELARLKVAAGLADHLDAALAGSSSPRVWLLLHEPGQTHLAALAALEFASVLSQRELAAFVLDGDDRTTTLSRWFGREATEGWIDLVRYGASVLTAGTALPGTGRTAYLLGVGSYAPTDVSAEETAELVARLRRQADDVLVVAPVDAAGLWGNLADIRLLCLDRSQRDAKDVAALCQRLDEAQAAPTGLIAWGKAGAAPTADAPAVEEPAAAAASQDTDAVPAEPAPADSPDALPPTGGERDPSAGRRTSGIFWFAAVVAMVIIVAVGIYSARYLKAPQEEPDGPAEPVAVVTPPATTEAPGTATADPADGAADATDTTAIAAAGDPTAAETVAEPEPEPDPEPATPAETAPARPVFDMAPYEVPVGQDGWALHLYSFPDSAAAASEVAILERRGLEAAVRVVEIAGKGRYHRVYVGSFPDRTTAREAMPALLERLRTDWANPVRFGATQR